METFWTVLGWIANVIQVATFVFTIWLLWRARQRFTKLIKALSGNTGDGKPVAIAVGIVGSIEGPVRSYLEESGAAMQIVPVTRSGFLKQRQFYDVLRELHGLKLALSDTGVTEVHLFYKGPVTLAMGIGAIFDNWVPVRVYEFNQKTGKYQLDLVLGKGAVFDLLDEIAEEGESAVLGRLAE